MRAGRLKVALALALLFCPAILLAARPAAAAPAAAGDQLHEDLALPYRLHLPAGRDTGTKAPLILLLHGMGSNEEDLFSLAGALPANFAVASARAPIAMGEDRFEWFEATHANGRLDGKPEQLRAAAARIRDFAGQLVKRYGLDGRRVYLVGFSQGAIMSYEAALPQPQRFKGIGVMSGSVFDSLLPEIKRSPALAKLQIFISHGEADPRIPVASARLSAERLAALGLTPETHIYPGMSHEINDRALSDLVHWLQTREE